MKKLVVLACLVLAIPNFAIQEANALDPNSVASIFDRLTSNKELANPSVIVIDEKTGEIVFEKNSTSPRKPASVLKLLTATAAYTYLQPTQRFTTSAFVGTKAKTLVIQGSLDPWISLIHTQAVKMGRTSLPRIEFSTLNALKKANNGSLRNITIYYTNLYSQDVANIQKFYFRHGVHAAMKRVTTEDAQSLSADQILSSDSPELQEILAFTLTWSDNLLAERIARLASAAAGHTSDDAGVGQTFDEVLNGLGIESKNLVTQDASGLSKLNRITAKQVGTLLIKIRENAKFAPLIGGLPIGGISGTLKDRFIKTAPQAVGLIKAKTGTLNGTSNLAGYVESGDREYAFVILADQLRKTHTAESLARNTVDRILGRIAFPILPGVIEEAPGQLGVTDQFGNQITTTN
jgi:serine-type D-Ala-D-Ala carboxypeptidase/endopeptidase (penicillin-binding protein 4)